MNNSEIEKLRKKYAILLDYKKEINDFKKRKEELEKNDIVSEYIAITEMLNSKRSKSFYGVENLTEDQILDELTANISLKDDANLYVFIGNENRGKYKEFKNIETRVVCIIEKKDLENFEKNNVVMYPNREEDKKDLEKFYSNIRREYFKTVLFEGSTNAEKLVKKKSLSNKQEN